LSPDDAFTMEEKFKKVGISTTRETDSSLSDAISSLSSASIFRKKNMCKSQNNGQNVAMIGDTFVAFCCSPIHAEPTGFITSIYLDVRITSKKFHLLFLQRIKNSFVLTVTV